MKKLLIFLALALPVITRAQDKGIKFEHGLTWEQVKAKAKKENKYIFVDCFTTWCGPCKFMSNTIFPLEDVGTYFNDKFINVKLQLDKTDKDNEEVKSWYATGEQIAKEYSVNAYPTFLFFNPNGEAVHRLVGGAQDGPSWIARASTALDPEKQYYAIMKKYEAGDRDPAFLKKAALSAQGAYDAKNAEMLSDAYIATQKDLYTKDNLEFLGKFTRSSKSPGFKLLLKDPAKANVVLGAGKAESILKQIILQEEVYKNLPKRNEETKMDWKPVETSLKKKYPKYADEVVLQGKVAYYQFTKDWDNFAKSVTSYMKKYGANVSPNELNEYAWTVFENCKDMTCVTEALEWSKRSFKDKENPMFIDTYANILHKMGRTKEAIEWQEKAISLLPDADSKAQYQQTLDKMKKGEKTWQN